MGWVREAVTLMGVPLGARPRQNLQPRSGELTTVDAVWWVESHSGAEVSVF
jgi:hypothetical protein